MYLMYWGHLESHPTWVYILYYLFLLATLVAGVANLSPKKNKLHLALLSIVLVFLIPPISIYYTIDRPPGVTEFQHLFTQLQQGALWSLFIFVSFIYLIVWWGILYLERRKNLKTP